MKDFVDHRGTEARRPTGCWVLLALALVVPLLIGCPAGPGLSSQGKLDNSAPKTLRGAITQRLADERSERAELAAKIAADIRSGALKEPSQYGEAWNKGDTAISQKTSETVSGLLRQAFQKAPHDKVWDEVGNSYR